MSYNQVNNTYNTKKSSKNANNVYVKNEFIISEQPIPKTNQIFNLLNSQTLSNIPSNSFYIVTTTEPITIILDKITNNSYTNFIIINTSDYTVTIDTNDNNILIYNSNPKNYNGSSTFYLGKKKMAIINNFYNNDYLAWLLMLS
jgi:hypothetical protein